MSSLAIFFLLCLSMHAGHARHHLGTFVAEELAKPVHFLPKELNKLNHEVGSHGRRRIQESWVGANTMKQALLNCFFKAKEAVAVAVAEAISGNEINNSGVDELQNMGKVEGFKRLARSMLGNSADVESKEKENVRDIDVMDYAQPHRKPPIHNEKP